MTNSLTLVLLNFFEFEIGKVAAYILHCSGDIEFAPYGNVTEASPLPALFIIQVASQYATIQRSKRHSGATLTVDSTSTSRSLTFNAVRKHFERVPQFSKLCPYSSVLNVSGDPILFMIIIISQRISICQYILGCQTCV